MQSQAIVFSGPNRAELQRIQIPSPASHEVLVEVHYSCVSPGTESRVLSGDQDGAPKFPLIPGYSASGLVVEAGAKTCIVPGTPVFLGGWARSSLPACWGAHIRHAVVPESSLLSLPETLSLRDASALKLMAIAAHGVRLGQCQPGENVAVLGLGPIGFLSALLHRTVGANVLVSDLLASRIDLAASQQLSAFGSEEVPFGEGADIVVDATGAAPVLARAAALLRERPWDDLEHSRTRLLIQGSYSVPPILPYDVLFLREPQVLIPRDNQRSDLENVVELLKSGRLSINCLLADFGSPQNASTVYSDLNAATQGAITGVFRWRD